jgi:hypothetical protein
VKERIVSDNLKGQKILSISNYKKGDCDVVEIGISNGTIVVEEVELWRGRSMTIGISSYFIPEIKISSDLIKNNFLDTSILIVRNQYNILSILSNVGLIEIGIEDHGSMFSSEPYFVKNFKELDQEEIKEHLSFFKRKEEEDKIPPEGLVVSKKVDEDINNVLGNINTKLRENKQ